MRRTAWLALAAALLPLHAARAAAPQGPPSVVVGVVGQAGSLDPLTYTTQTAADILSATSDGLLRYVPTTWPRQNQRYAWRPDLVASMPKLRVNGPPGPQAQVTITYRLRPGLRWSDGKPLTSQDIRFTWQAVMRPGSGAYQAGYNQITAVETPNPLTAVVRMRGTYAPWQTLFSFLLPYHALHGRIGRIAEDTAYSRRPLATGPYAVVYDRGGRVVLRRNPFYARQTGPTAQLPRIVVRAYRTQEQLVAALREGQIAVADDLQLSSSAFAALRTAGMRIQSVPGPTLEQFTFNLFHETTSDPSVRRAFYLALDRQGMSRSLTGGRLTVAASDQAPFGWAFDRSLPLQRQDIPKARRVLEADGYTPGPGGYMQRGGATLTLRVSLTDTPLHRAIVDAVVREEARAGIRVIASYQPVSALFGPGGMLARGQYEAALFSIEDGVDPNDAGLLNGTLGNRFIRGADFSGYDNPSVNAWTADAIARMGTAARVRDYRAVQRAIVRDLPIVPLFFLPVETAYNPRVVRGITVNDFGGSLWSAGRWSAK